jgi:hypothetical protein
MKGTLIGVSVFVVLSIAVSLAAVGAVTQTYSGTAPGGINSMAVPPMEKVPGLANPEEQSGVYRAFTYVCPFH